MSNLTVEQSSAPVPATAPPVIPGPRTWTRRIHNSGQITEVCPEWCTATHANDREGCMDDLVHAATCVSMKVEMHMAGTDGPAAWPILAVSIEQHPYSSNPAWRTPHVSVEPSVDDVMECLGLAEYDALLDSVRAHLVRMEQQRARLAEILQRVAGAR
jgi:hypothetical protein